MPYVIRYRYPGTVQGDPVGVVYAVKCSWGRDVWSYEKHPAHAEWFPTEAEAEAERVKHSWPESAVEFVGAQSKR